MEKYIDLHTHSTFSDGTLTPTELVKLIKDIGLSAFALTDHDNIDGIEEAIETGKKYGVEVVTGIEFSTETDTELHILGLDFSMDCPEIRNQRDIMISDRNERNSKIIGLLKENGMIVTETELKNAATSSIIGRSQIAKVLTSKGYVNSVKEAFEKYLSFGKPAYVQRQSLSPEKAIEIIHSANGKAILAHLNQTGKTDEELYPLLAHLKDSGLDGIEGYYTEYTDDMNCRYRKMASDLGLKLSGGSDFHGKNKNGYFPGNVKIPYSVLENLRK